MIVIKLDKKNQRQVLAFAVAALFAGKTIIYPTETFYGLGCDAANSRAIKKIYRIKGRAKQKKLPMVAADLKTAKRYLVFTAVALKLARAYWPGPLSLVLKTTVKGRKLLGSGDQAMRVSSHPFVLALTEAFGKPVISTSANLSGEPSAQSARSVVKYFRGRKVRPDLVIDAGRLPKSKGSTFIDLTGKEPKILRQGDIKIKIQGHKIQ